MDKDKLKILFIINHYHSPFSPNIININELINYCVAKGNNVDVLSTDNEASNNLPLIQETNGVRVFCFWNEYNKGILKYNVDSVSSFKDLPKTKRLLCKTHCFLRALFKIKTDYYAVEGMSFRYIRKTIGNHYDVIISESAPFVSHLIASYLIKKRCSEHWFPIIFDPYVYNEMDGKKGRLYRKYSEQKILKKSTRVFQLMGIDDINKNNNYHPHYSNKCIAIPLFNLFNRQISNCSQTEKEHIRLQYVGNFYYNLRNPSKMMEILSCLPREFEVHFVGGGCRSIVEEKAKMFNECSFFNDGVVEYNSIPLIYAKSNILLFLDNEQGGQFPSKCFEYISYCKPVINFYYSEESLSYKIFKDYKYALNININNFKPSDIEIIISFCKKNKYARIEYNSIIKNFKNYENNHVLSNIYQTICNNL